MNRFSFNISLMNRITPCIFFLLTISLFAQDEPSWIKNFPLDDDFYTGVGSSNTGNRSTDYQKALIQARLNLAAEISTKIESETEIRTEDSTNGDLSESYTEKINQSVEQNLKELETVDSYYSQNQGYWVYIRLNKNRWKEIQRTDLDQLRTRISQIINNEYFEDRLTTADKLFKLSTAFFLLNNSPYGYILNGHLDRDYNENVLDFLSSEIYSLSSQLSINIDGDNFFLESGNTLDLNISIQSLENFTGKLPLTISSDDIVLVETFSDTDGDVQIQLNSDSLSEGMHQLTLKIDPIKIGFPQNSSLENIFKTAEKEILLTIESKSVYLNIESNKSNLNYIEEPLGTLFSSGNESLTLSTDRDRASFTIDVSLNFTDYPRIIENAPLMAGLDCTISLKKGNRTVYEYQNVSLKDGGLTYDQAYNRVFRQLLDSLSADKSIIKSIEKETNK